MSRPLRIEHENAWYHVMNRGTNHQNIFHSELQRGMFIELLHEIFVRYSVEIHAFCLMDNHYHLLIHTPFPNLSRAMRHLDGVYTQRFNLMEKKDGSLFRGRYKSILIEPESYLLQVSRYIHLNPVIAGISKKPEDFKWSSYSYYLGLFKAECWMKIDFILGLMGNYDAAHTYQLFMSESADDKINKFYTNRRISPILGKKDFIQKHLAKFDNINNHPSSTDINRTKIQYPIEIIIDSITKYFGISRQNLKFSVPGKLNIARIIAMHLSFQLCQFTHAEIADYFFTTRENVATSLKRFNHKYINSGEIKLHLDLIVNKITLRCP